MPVPGPHADAERRAPARRSRASRPRSSTGCPGEHHLAPDAADCASVGAMLAGMHLAAPTSRCAQPNLRGLAWWTETVPVVLPHLDAAPGRADARTSSPSSSSSPRRRRTRRCRAAAIHGDLFRDNVMFEGDAPRRRVRLLLRRRRHLALRHRRRPQRLVHRPRHRAASSRTAPAPSSPPTTACARSRPPSCACCRR